MTKQNQKEVSVPKEEYKKLKRLEQRFQGFWDYLEYLLEIRDARKEVDEKKVISQEKLFEELDL